MGYFTTVLADAPNHWWRLADPGGAIANDIGSAAPIPMLVTNLGSLLYRGMTSDGLGAFMAPGGQQIRVASNILNVPAANWTLELWAWMFFYDTTDQYIECGVVGGGAPRFGIRQLIAGTILFYVVSGTMPVGTTVATFNPRTWHHLVMTYDGANLRLYVDAVLQGTVAGVTGAIGNVAVYLDGDTGGGQQGNMIMEDVAFYTTVLTPARITAHYLAADLIANKPFYTGGGTYPTTTFSTSPISVDVSTLLGASTVNLGNQP